MRCREARRKSGVSLVILALSRIEGTEKYTNFVFLLTGFQKAVSTGLSVWLKFDVCLLSPCAESALTIRFAQGVAEKYFILEESMRSVTRAELLDTASMKLEEVVLLLVEVRSVWLAKQGNWRSRWKPVR